MTRIRKVEITNFRCIRSFTWRPSPGLNCLIGPGDSGKSTVLDAIDLCLGARRTVQFNDADFYNLDVASPITIVLTIGELDASLKSLDAYGLFLRGLNAETGVVEDEPEKELETVLSLGLTVANDLEPVWALISDRGTADGTSRSLAWSDRVRLAPTAIGTIADQNLGWRRGSVLNRLTDEKADASAALVAAARHARTTFGDDAEPELASTLSIVRTAANELGINVGGKVRALLDAHSVTFSGGSISLHNEAGVPLHGLGTGSSRLLIAGLQRKAAQQTSILLVDELEHGLEPHRIIRFLGSLGAKESPPPLQAFMTTHSPVAIRELTGNHLHVLRSDGTKHTAQLVGEKDSLQGAIRAFPDAFLATSVLVCEGASEVGLMRGLDQHRAATGKTSLFASGTALVDCGGGSADRPFERGDAFIDLGYKVAILRDDDVKPTPPKTGWFDISGGTVFSWRDGRALEDELFASLSDSAIGKLLDLAIELLDRELVDQHIKTASGGAIDLDAVETENLWDALSATTKAVLGKAARFKANPWFKSVSRMERVAREIVADDLDDADPDFRRIIEAVFAWATSP
ncbi:AAA family ATPase (plasmid) [Methylocapsa polymorpha]|uniref:AAA family ATPase n=1 Tax=Methylocapsa polymorpha TaxID=3080828 RepID=A0ABZ0HY34_9HYPH|nr:AAA family ATPase [Methylocapsa sp. RX1]WOJ91760.1 AAA family ATPase [Methylocapsa sp. RX1]